MLQETGVEHLDVVVVGAGLSGIGAAAQLRRRRPADTVAVLESRNAIGGTWDLFRYPGVRSDSDMFTLGYASRPWLGEKAIAAGADIRDYVVDAAREEGVEPLIRLRHRVLSAEWRSDRARWTLTVLQRDPAALGEWRDGEPDGTTTTITCSFLFICSGYYRYDQGYSPDIPGLPEFAGTVVHPQHWPADLDVDGKRVVVIGSGATAVTLVPALAQAGAHVAMLQRSPSWVAAVPSRDRVVDRWRAALPATTAYRLARAKHVLTSLALYQYARRRPERMKSVLLKAAAAKLPTGYDVGTHFTPSYDPWDQRLCAVPSGDLFRAISSGMAEVVTDRIDRVEEHGIALASGSRLDADVVVTATGLNLLAFGGIALSVDRRPVEPGRTLAYKGMMLDGVPNLAFTVGYTNASWTLKADLVARYVVRLLDRMQRRGERVVTPSAAAGGEEGSPLIGFSSGYVRRGIDQLPRQGARTPWRVHQNYLRDLALFRLGRLGRGVRFSSATRPVAVPVGR